MVLTEPILSNLIRSLNDSVVYTVKEIVKRDDVAKDIAMISWQIIWERREDFDDLEKVKAFLYIAAKNMALTWLRGQHNRDKLARKNVSFVDEQASPEDSVVNKTFVTEAIKLIQAIFPKHYETVFTMTLNGYTNTQIAAAIGRKPSTVTSIRSLITDRLKNYYNKVEY